MSRRQFKEMARNVRLYDRGGPEIKNLLYFTIPALDGVTGQPNSLHWTESHVPTFPISSGLAGTFHLAFDYISYL